MEWWICAAIWIVLCRLQKRSGKIPQELRHVVSKDPEENSEQFVKILIEIVAETSGVVHSLVVYLSTVIMYTFHREPVDTFLTRSSSSFL